MIGKPILRSILLVAGSRKDIILFLSISMSIIFSSALFADPDLTSDNPYRILDVPENVSEEGLKEALRKGNQYLREHGNGLKQFEKLARAFETIGNSIRDRDTNPTNQPRRQDFIRPPPSLKLGSPHVPPASATSVEITHYAERIFSNIVETFHPTGSKPPSPYRHFIETLIYALTTQVHLVSRTSSHGVIPVDTMQAALFRATNAFLGSHRDKILDEYTGSQEVLKLAEILYAMEPPPLALGTGHWISLQAFHQDLIEFGLGRAKTSREYTALALQYLMIEPRDVSELNRFRLPEMIKLFQTQFPLRREKTFLEELIRAGVEQTRRGKSDVHKLKELVWAIRPMLLQDYPNGTGTPLLDSIAKGMDDEKFEREILTLSDNPSGFCNRRFVQAARWARFIRRSH